MLTVVSLKKKKKYCGGVTDGCFRSWILWIFDFVMFDSLGFGCQCLSLTCVGDSTLIVVLTIGISI